MLPPEHIHPALWRATQLAQSANRGISTGYAALSAQLPGGGWPVGALIELLTPHAGVGEIRLLQPALAQLDRRHPIALVQPPHAPHLACWQGWQLNPAQLLWVAPERPLDALWAAEQILKHGSCGALLCWLPRVRPESLRRLHLAAQASDTLCVVLRPAAAAQHASPAPLRLALTPAAGGLSVHILKRRGPACTQPLFLVFDTTANKDTTTPPRASPAPAPTTASATIAPSRAAPARASITPSADARTETELFDHVSVDRRLSTPPAARRRTPALVS